MGQITTEQKLSNSAYTWILSNSIRTKKLGYIESAEEQSAGDFKLPLSLKLYSILLGTLHIIVE